MRLREIIAKCLQLTGSPTIIVLENRGPKGKERKNMNQSEMKAKITKVIDDDLNYFEVLWSDSDEDGRYERELYADANLNQFTVEAIDSDKFRTVLSYKLDESEYEVAFEFTVELDDDRLYAFASGENSERQFEEQIEDAFNATLAA